MKRLNWALFALLALLLSAAGTQVRAEDGMCDPCDDSGEQDYCCITDGGSSGTPEYVCGDNEQCQRECGGTNNAEVYIMGPCTGIGTELWECVCQCNQ